LLLRNEFVLFVATTAERFFRIDQAQEQLHYATDIFSEELFIVYPEGSAAVKTASQQDQRATGDSSSSEHRPLHRVNAKRSVSSPSRSAQ